MSIVILEAKDALRTETLNININSIVLYPLLETDRKRPR